MTKSVKNRNKNNKTKKNKKFFNKPFRIENAQCKVGFSLKSAQKMGRFNEKRCKGGALLKDSEVNPGHKNRTFRTPVNDYSFFYIIPNTLALKNIETIKSPKFFIHVDSVEKELTVKITDKRLANCFVKVEGTGQGTEQGNGWYVVVRLGNFANSGVVANWTNTVFYKLKDGIFNIDKDNKITIKPEACEMTTSWGIFSNNESLRIKDEYLTGITSKDKPVFDALNRFRREQIVGFALKEYAAEKGVEAGFDFFKFISGN